MTKKIIVWFKRDFRFIDNPALYYAAQDGVVIPVYIHFPTSIKGKLTNSEIFHDQALLSFQKTINQSGGRLLIREEDPATILPKLIQEAGANALYFNLSYEPEQVQLDQYIYDNTLVPVQRFHAGLLTEPGTILNKQGKPYKVFTSFWKSLSSFPIQKPLPQPKEITWEQSEVNEKEPIFENTTISSHWKAGGEKEALNKLQLFFRKSIRRL